ncbi:hypothetical protein TSOC_001427 [Tetrabaena socialis]|uniref:Uncharacterized protein n=1 Tax=Tetrabaena socialis TaxID=47790 RepID=A0A2J8AGV4_9CHLO|nr:hypothetical protein TSOC_001427 [Tetrabaena socialis]|eukprot:PNH11741.1 hypothetical protein TSOC_001427 [Tetrabaena socialis]
MRWPASLAPLSLLVAAAAAAVGRRALLLLLLLLLRVAERGPEGAGGGEAEGVAGRDATQRTRGQACGSSLTMTRPPSLGMGGTYSSLILLTFWPRMFMAPRQPCAVTTWSALVEESGLLSKTTRLSWLKSMLSGTSSSLSSSYTVRPGTTACPSRYSRRRTWGGEQGAGGGAGGGVQGNGGWKAAFQTGDSLLSLTPVLNCWPLTLTTTPSAETMVKQVMYSVAAMAIDVR